MKHILQRAFAILFLAASGASQAQVASFPPSFYHTLLAVLGTGQNFSGTATVQFSNGPDKDPATMNMSVAMLGGTLRVEFDSFPVGTNLSPLEANALKQMHSICILRPDINRSYSVFPMFNSYVETAYLGGVETNVIPLPKIGRAPGTKENVGTQPCQRSIWSIVEGKETQYDATVWTATNLNNFPVQIKMASPAALVLFQDLRMENPNGELFVPPAGYTKYEGIEALIKKSTQRAQPPPEQ